MKNVESKRSEKFSKARKLLANLTDEQREQIANSFGVVTVEGRVLSRYNQLLLSMQSGNLESKPSVVGGFNQWKKSGRIVKKGATSLIIWIPTIKSSDKPENETELNFLLGNVFDIQQTEPLEPQQNN